MLNSKTQKALGVAMKRNMGLKKLGVVIALGLMGHMAPSGVLASDLNTALGGGAGAAVGSVIGKSQGGKDGQVIGAAIGGAAGGALTTKGSGQTGAALGGAVGGAAGASMGGTAGAAVGGAAGAVVGKNLTESQPTTKTNTIAAVPLSPNGPNVISQEGYAGKKGKGQHQGYASNYDDERHPSCNGKKVGHHKHGKKNKHGC